MLCSRTGHQRIYIWLNLLTIFNFQQVFACVKCGNIEWFSVLWLPRMSFIVCFTEGVDRQNSAWYQVCSWARVTRKLWPQPNTLFPFCKRCNLYINWPFAFENALSDPFVLPNGAKLNSLLYADDLIILSRSKTGFQNCLNTLSSFCTSWILKINPKKTKFIMVFQKRARKCAEFRFFI